MSEIVFETLSICKVIEGPFNDPDNYLLKRLYDINDNSGVVEKVHIQDHKPPFFENRDRIYRNDGPNELDKIGVWLWNARPNNTNPEKDYVRSSYQPQIHLIFVKVLNEVESFDALTAQLKRGIEFGFDNAIKENWMILYRDTHSEYSGVYCERGTMDGHGGFRDSAGRLKNSITRLQKVSITPDDIYSLGNHKIYRFLDVDPIEEVLTQSTNEIVKNCILGRTTWKAFNSFTGATHAEHNLFKEFLNSIATDIYGEVAEKCGCDQLSAKQLVDGFVEMADTYIDGDDIESEVLLSIVEGKEDIRERFEKIVEQRWLEDNKSRIEESEEEIAYLMATKAQTEEDVRELVARKQEAEKELQDSIAQNKKTQADLELAIREKIDALNNNLGEVLADAIYFEKITEKNVLEESPIESSNYCPGSEMKVEEEPENAADVNDLLVYNLNNAGVSKDYSDVIAAFLIAAMHNNSPVILAGPNGKEIANAFSASIYGRKAGNYRFRGDTEILDTLGGNKSDKVIIVNNFCDGNLVDVLPDVINDYEKMLFLVTPYHEDLFVEPAGLYNYALPLMTEWFVDSAPYGEYVGGKASSKWDDSIESKTIKRNISNAIQAVGMKKYLCKRYMKILGDAVSLLENPERKDLLGYMTALIPFSIATGNMMELYEYLDKDETIEKKLKEDILAMCGEE